MKLEKIAIAQINSHAGQLDHNLDRIKSFVDKALSRNVQLVIFPELSIPGYLALDLFRDPFFIVANEEALGELILYSKKKPIAIIVGYARSRSERFKRIAKPFNSAAVIVDGKLLTSIDKVLLPDYDIFWENRYFSSGVVAQPVDLYGRKLGIGICEDLFYRDYPTKIYHAQAKAGAEILINIAASPFCRGKFEERQNLISEVVHDLKRPFYYANMVGAQDGYEGDIIFDGRSLVYDSSGNLLALGRAFQEELLEVGEASHKIDIDTSVAELYEALICGVKEFFARNGFKRAYIGLSGGIDSAVVLVLAVAALGAENVVGVTLPSSVSSQATIADAETLAKNLGIKFIIRPIKGLYEKWSEEAGQSHEELASLTKQNVQARLRAVLLMEYVNQDRDALLLNTSNKTESAVGYSTLYGDMAGALAVIGDVNKLMVYELAKYINRIAKSCPPIPEAVITRLPTAELEEGQTDAANLPADYPVLSPLVDEIVERQTPAAELVAQLEKSGVSNADEIVKRTINMIQAAEHKRRQMPPALRISKKAFGAGRRMPVSRGLFQA